MTDPSDSDGPNLPMLGKHDPSQYRTQSSKERFAVSKFYGMGSDGSWTVERIADEMEVTERQVYRYLNESDIGKEVREMLAVTEAEWRLDMALQLRREVERLEDIEQELLQRKKAVPTSYDTKTVEGTPTGDRNIRLAEHTAEYRLEMPVPTNFETVTDYSQDLESVQKEKRQYLSQIADLLGLNAADKREIDHNLASQHSEVKVVEVRQTDDPYPEAEPIDASDASTEELTGAPEPVDVEVIDEEED